MVLAILRLLVPCVTARLQEVSLTKLLSYLGSLDIDKDADNFTKFISKLFKVA